ncbi:hypothetical protein AK830_g3938 [Neonectria ditissima]|uniref:Uncharacterized protein n=1 Tax=Neonectria ditissima TaxID=78410 RepID=A0A0P7BH42_9HYPO|nr:hypothetical protein AK830_g3938 [Neonectria ditissima]
MSQLTHTHAKSRPPPGFSHHRPTKPSAKSRPLVASQRGSTPLVPVPTWLCMWAPPLRNHGVVVRRYDSYSAGLAPKLDLNVGHRDSCVIPPCKETKHMADRCLTLPLRSHAVILPISLPPALPWGNTAARAFKDFHDAGRASPELAGSLAGPMDHEARRIGPAIADPRAQDEASKPCLGGRLHTPGQPLDHD